MNHCAEIRQEQKDDLRPGTLRSQDFDVQKVLAEGWVHKKGSGNDFFGSRAWKPRWARLVVSLLSFLDQMAEFVIINAQFTLH